MILTTKTKPKRPEPADPRSAATQAAERLQADREEERSEIGREKADCESAYVSALLAADAELLTAAAGGLGLAPEDVAEDGEIVARAQRAAERIDRREELAKAATAARADVRELKKRHRAELLAAHKKLRQAERAHNRSCLASNELTNLARKRPLLFNDSSDPPRLRRPE